MNRRYRPFLLLIAAFAVAGIVLLLRHAAPVRCYRIFLQLSIVFFVLVLFQHVRRATVSNAVKTASRFDNCFLIAALIASSLIYATTLRFNFVSDDYTLLLMSRRPFAQALHEYFFVGQVDSSGAAIFYRPFAFAAVNFEYLLWGAWIPGYHLACVALHLVCVAGVFYVCRELQLPRQVAGVAALFFAVMPVNAQAVTWATCIFDRIAAASMLGSIALYLRFRRARRWPAIVLSVVFFVIALESKEFAYTLPLMLLAAEFALKDDHQRGAAIRVVSFFAVAAAAFLWRGHIIRGVGGYHTVGGDPSVLHLDRAFKAVFVRAPGETLFGFNWLQPASVALLVVVAGTAVLLIYAAGKYRPGAWRSISLLTLAWLVLSVAPAHFLFWWPDPGLTFSRTLYFAAACLAIFLALLLCRVAGSPLLRNAAVITVAVLFGIALLHNIAAWRLNSRMTARFLVELKHVEPSPAPHTTICVDDLPEHINGIQFFDVNPTAAAQYAYGWSTDVVLERSSADCLSKPSPVHLRWNHNTGTLSSVPSPGASQ